MKRLFRHFIPALLCLLGYVYAGAQDRRGEYQSFSPSRTSAQEKKVSLGYDVYFSFDFDNREFRPTEGIYTSSGTIFSAQLTPSVGVDVRQSDKISHSVRAGIDVVKNMGESPIGAGTEKLQNWGLLREITLWYNINALAGDTRIKAYAGILPRRFMQGEYSKAQFSDSLRIFDKNLEGALITLERPRATYEFGCDWMGMKAPGRRERFMLFSYGQVRPVEFFSFGWSITAYHYAGAADYGHVADNILAEPFVKFDLGYKAWMQELSARLSFLVGGQRLRDVSKDFSFPMGGELRLAAKNWNVGLDNRTYVGTSLMPFYNAIDDGGHKLGSDLYWGSPMYRIHSSPEAPWNAIGWYDRAEIYYAPRIADFLDLRLGVALHLTGDAASPFTFAGWQQTLSLVFDLDKLLHKDSRPAAKSRKKNWNFKETI